jgi:NADH dehydrogenase
MMTENKKTAKAFSIPSPAQQKWTAALAWIADSIDFLGRTAWPINDLLIRVWIAKQTLLSGFLMATDWDTAVALATDEYPVPWVDPHGAALLGILAQLGGGLSLLLGLGTRFGAMVILGLTAVTHIYYTAIDLNLFWIALMVGYVLRGAGAFSFDRLLAQGLKRSPLPFAAPVTDFFSETKPALTAFYLLALRLWLMLTLMLTSVHVPYAMSEKAMGFLSWLPPHSATLLFGSVGILIALLLGTGFATRLAALLGIIIVIYHAVMAGDVSFPFYWIVILALLLTYGPGKISLDYALLSHLKLRFPQLSGEPAFSLEGLPLVVIVGAGFGGVACAKALRHAPVKVTLIDSHNYNLFQPLLYQVATAGPSPGDIAVPIRSFFRDQFNTQVLLASVTDIDTQKRQVIAGDLHLSYDYLVVATGATHSYFGKDAWAPYAPGLKRVDDATTIRRRVLEAFERAEIADTDDERHRLLNFIIVGGGPTGVELAGAIAELARFGMEKDFRNFDPSSANIILVQAAPRILPTFREALSAIAQKSLEEIGVRVLINSTVEQIDSEGVIVNGQRIYSKSVLWAAGVTASPAAKWLKAEADNAGRVKVADDLSVPGLSNVFVIGDTAAANCWDGKPVPGLAMAAKQGGVYAAKTIVARLFDKPQSPFAYNHLGSLATIGRKAAVADFGPINMSGAMAWWFWGFIHIFFLVGARNRQTVILNWLWSYFTFRASTRLITGTPEQN